MTDLRLAILPTLTTLALGAIGARLWYVQIARSEVLKERASHSRVRTLPVPAPRGAILDRDGRLLADVRAELYVTVRPRIAKDPEVRTRLAGVLGMRLDRLLAKLDGGGRVVVQVGTPVQAASRIAERPDLFPGVEIASRALRHYTDEFSASHALGYVTFDAEAEEETGKSGLEAALDDRLKGRPGARTIAVDARGRSVREFTATAARPGETLRTTLDADLQKLATRLFARRGYRGAAVALDPRTGEVLLSVSAPVYGQSLFAGGLSRAEWAGVTEHPGKPLLDRATGSAYAPGSTFKIVTALAADAHGGFDPSARVFCDGAFRIDGSRFGCLGHHGSVNLEEATAKSCNVYFATIGHRIGRAAIVETARALGLGTKPGTELGGETAGTLPDERWLARSRPDGRWLSGDAVNASIGQGAVSASAMQMAVVAATAANGGLVPRPHFVRGEGRAPRRGPGSARFWSAERRALERVMTVGTGRKLRIEGVRWAGKTGSAEHGRSAKSHAWFVAYAPVDDPKIAICTMAESAGHGGEVAGPIARNLVAAYLSKLSKRAAAASASAGDSPIRR